jgi:hypothetical protein
MATKTPRVDPIKSESAIEMLTKTKVGAIAVNRPSETGRPFKAVPSVKSPEKIDRHTSLYQPINLSGID